MAKNDGRRYRRVCLNLPARIVINAVDEYDGQLINMSPGDMALIADTKAVIGDAIVVHINGLDIIEGTVARITPDGLAVSFLLSKRRRALLTEQLILRANPSFADGLSDRRNTPRHLNSNSRTVCRLADGTSLFVKVVDMSVDGISVDAARRPPLGSEIHVGRQCGIVTRHTPRGFVIVYGNASKQRQPILRAV